MIINVWIQKLDDIEKRKEKLSFTWSEIPLFALSWTLRTCSLHTTAV